MRFDHSLTAGGIVIYSSELGVTTGAQKRWQTMVLAYTSHSQEQNSSCAIIDFADLLYACCESLPIASCNPHLGTHFVFVLGRRFLLVFAKGISTAAAAFSNRRKVCASFVRGRRRG